VSTVEDTEDNRHADELYVLENWEYVLIEVAGLLFSVRCRTNRARTKWLFVARQWGVKKKIGVLSDNRRTACESIVKALRMNLLMNLKN
jgi:hypothetical protein